MKQIITTLTFLLVILQLTIAQQLTQQFYIDFGQNNPGEGRRITEIDAAGNHWNNVVAPNGSPSTLNPVSLSLKNAGNESTGIDLEVVRAIRSNGGSNGGLKSPDPALLGDLAVETATEDYFFLDNGMGKGFFRLKNLDPAKAYKFYIFGCRVASGNQRGIIFSLSGKNGSHGKQLNTGTGIGADGFNGNNNNVWESSLVVPTSGGEIMLELGRLFNTEMAYISAMKIEEYSGYELPAAETSFYVDFGKNNNGLDGAPTTGTDINGNFWNNIYSNGDGPTTGPSDGTGVVLLKNALNETSSYELELASTVQFNGVRNGALGGTDSPGEPTAALLGDLAVKTATFDYLFLDNQKAILNFKNLITNKLYRISVVGSRKDDSAEGRVGRIEIVGNSTVTGIHQMGGSKIGANGENYNNKNIFISDLMSPSSAGQLTFTMSTWLGFAHINCIKLEEIAGASLPDATSMSIIGGTAITSCGRFLDLSVTALPQGALVPAVTWTVDKPEIARITESGRLYAKANGTVTVTASATTAGGAQLTDSREIVVSGQNIGDYSFTVMGSSVPWGQGADPRDVNGYAWLWTNYLKSKAARTWTTNNISIGGNNTTDVTNRWDSDLLPSCSRYVFYGLSLGNEGIHERGQVAYDSWRDNMLKLIDRTHSHGKIPVIGNNYPRGDFNATDYNYLKQLNLLIHEWDVASVNLLGSIDNGSGQWASGYVADNAHPNTAGHAEMFYAVVPSLMDALANRKAQPVRNRTASLNLTKTDEVKRIVFTPENIAHSFTFSFDFKTTGMGTVASFETADGTTHKLEINAEGKLVYKSHTSAAALNDGEWHTATLTHYYAAGTSQLYIDGHRIPRTTLISERLVPEKFSVNDFVDAPESIAFRELFFFRAGMCAEEIAALYEGKMLKSSLEIYSPLNVDAATDAQPENRAQSTNTLTIEKQDIVNTVHNPEMGDNLRELIVYSLSGQEVLRSSSGDVRSTKLPKGIYILKRITTDNAVFSRKMLVE